MIINSNLLTVKQLKRNQNLALSFSGGIPSAKPKLILVHLTSTSARYEQPNITHYQYYSQQVQLI